MKSLVRKWLMGDTVFSEYSKITADDDLAQKVWLKAEDEIIEVSPNHWLLCIEPIMYGVWLEKKASIHLEGKKDFIMYLGGNLSNNNSRIHEPEAILTLELFDRIEESEGTLLVLKLKKTSLHQLNFIRRYLLFFRYYKKDGLTFSRFKAFVSAYSYPRRIRVVSFRKDNYYNIFPMDLLGDMAQSKRYVFGLRHTNVTLKMILETGKLVVSEVPREFQDKVYALGKHHGGNPPSIDSLPFKVTETRNFNFYIPEWVESYKEVSVIKTINMGSHMLLWGEVIAENRLKEPSAHLFLVHFLHYLHQKNLGRKYSQV